MKNYGNEIQKRLFDYVHKLRIVMRIYFCLIPSANFDD